MRRLRVAGTGFPAGAMAAGPGNELEDMNVALHQSGPVAAKARVQAFGKLDFGFAKLPLSAAVWQAAQLAALLTAACFQICGSTSLCLRTNHCDRVMRSCGGSSDHPLVRTGMGLQPATDVPHAGFVE